MLELSRETVSLLSDYTKPALVKSPTQPAIRVNRNTVNMSSKHYDSISLAELTNEPASLDELKDGVHSYICPGMGVVSWVKSKSLGKHFTNNKSLFS